MSRPSLGFLTFGVSKPSDWYSQEEIPGTEVEERGSRWKQTHRVGTVCQHFTARIRGKMDSVESLFLILY